MTITRSRNKVLGILERHKQFALKGKEFFLKVRKDAINIISLLTARNVESPSEINYDLRSLSNSIGKTVSEDDILDLLFSPPFIFDITKLELELPKLEIDKDLSLITNSDTYSDISIEDSGSNNHDKSSADFLRKQFRDNSSKLKEDKRSRWSLGSLMSSNPDSKRSQNIENYFERINGFDDEDEEIRKLTRLLNRRAGHVDSQIVSPTSTIANIKDESPYKELNLQSLLQPITDAILIEEHPNPDPNLENLPEYKEVSSGAIEQMIMLDEEENSKVPMPDLPGNYSPINKTIEKSLKANTISIGSSNNIESSSIINTLASEPLSANNIGLSSGLSQL